MAVEVTGLKEFRAALKALGPEWPKALTEVHQQIGRRGAALARGRASTPLQAKAQNTIKGRGTQRSATIAVSGMKGLGNVAFWGAKRHTGWYGKSRYRASPAQHPKWVGNSWDAAVHGQGPYAINDALADNLPDIIDQYVNMINILAAKAFPEG